MNDELKIDLQTLGIGTLPMGCLASAEFRIPAYQRGYRWKAVDVLKLLLDLEEFIDEGKIGKDARLFYCLQPLVVRKSKDHASAWEVVDGQQRLTTLFLVWKFLNNQAPYVLSYETRECSREFLNAPTAMVDGKKQPNIDFHHIHHAFKTIQDWFKSGNEEQKKKQFRDLLENTEPKGRNVRFIWYRLVEGDDAVAAFTRLNVGKIPLTDEELIRALFLRTSGSDKLAFQHRLALEWDRIETALQEPSFWGFLSNETPPEGGRIRLLFQLCAPETLKDDNHALFDHYQKRLAVEPREKPSLVWNAIVAIFEQLEEWYRDPELFHLVGYLATILRKKSCEPLRELLGNAQAKTKKEFAVELRRKIREQLIDDGKKTADFIGELDYLQNSGPIRPTLALFNIATILRTKGVRIRFPFHLYHDTKVGWDIEHVQSQAGDDLKERSGQEKWLEACKPELEHDAASPSNENGQEGTQNEVADKARRAKQLIAEIEVFTKPGSSVIFPELEKEIRQHFEEAESTDENINDIGNLTLLDAPTNRGYGNAPFVVKRTEILKHERPKGTFILPCTRDLFLKVFSKNAGNLRRWDIKNDGAAHKAAICEALETFFGEKGGVKS